MGSDRNIILKTREEIELIRKSALLVGDTLAEVAKHIKEGTKTISLDKLAYTFIKDNGGSPSFLNYKVGDHKFPYSLCISVNDVVVHGFPSEYELRNGDIISVDCGVYKNGFHGDSAYTFTVGEVDQSTLKLLEVTKECLYAGIKKCRVGSRVEDISFAIQEVAKSNKYGIVRELTGHGLGRDLHEAPEVPNYGKRGNGKKLMEGMVIAIEPMINMGTADVVSHSDNWTISTRDKLPSAHFEHTVAIVNGVPEILSSFEAIERILNN